MARAIRIWLTLLAIAIGAGAVALSVGSTRIAFFELMRALFGPDQSIAYDIVHKLRLPRALAAFAVGGLLAYAGALMQVLLRNPLADPYVLGLSGGAAVGALAAMLAGLGALYVSAGAFAGAMLSVSLVFMLSHRELARLHSVGTTDASPRLLLTGVILAAGWSAAITLILTVAPDAQLRGMLFWLMGDLSGGESYAAALFALPIVVVVSYPLSRALNAMLRGDVFALSLGVPVATVRRAVFALASVATALAVTTAGTVAFVGLIVPHALRLVIGNDQRILLPACALAGGAFLMLADAVARTVVAPLQIPVGVVTALVGVPAFMLLMLRSGPARGSQ